MRAVVAGGRGGIGAATVAALADANVVALDLAESDAGEPEASRSLDGEFDAACRLRIASSS